MFLQQYTKKKKLLFSQHLRINLLKHLPTEDTPNNFIYILQKETTFAKRKLLSYYLNPILKRVATVKGNKSKKSLLAVVIHIHLEVYTSPSCGMNTLGGKASLESFSRHLLTGLYRYSGLL